MNKIPYLSAVHGQPENLEMALQSLKIALSKMEPPQWLPGETVGVIAMGASSHSANALVHALAASGIRGINITASDLDLTPAGFQPADHYVIVSESGRSPEPINSARLLTKGKRIGITNVPDAPISEVLDHVLPLGGFDDSQVYTIGYTATLLAYNLLVRAAGLNIEEADRTRPEAIPELVRKTLSDYASIASDAAQLLHDAEAVDFVGRGYSFASASEAALLFREAIRVPTSAFETYQYLHGPMEPLDKRSGLVVFGDDREVPMVDSALKAGAKVVLLTTAERRVVADPNHKNLVVIQLPAGIAGFAKATVEIVVLQLIAGVYADRAGLKIEEFRFHQDDTKLTKSPPKM